MKPSDINYELRLLSELLVRFILKHNTKFKSNTSGLHTRHTELFSGGESFCVMFTMNNCLQKGMQTLLATAYLSGLAVQLDLRQTRGLLRCSEGLKLTEVGKIGLLGNLLWGGGGEHRSTSWCTLCVCTMPAVWQRHWCLQIVQEKKEWSEGLRVVEVALSAGFMPRTRGHTLRFAAYQHLNLLLLLLREEETFFSGCLTCVGSGRGGTAGG